MKYLHKMIILLLLLGSTSMWLNAESNIEKFNEDYYTQICKKLISCADNFSVAETLMLMQVVDVKDCVKKVSKRDSAQVWKATFDRKKIEFNPENISSCLSSIKKLSCQTIASRITKPSGLKGCEKVIVGSIADYEKCSSHLECSGVATACYDTCQPPMLLECGEEQCNASEYCDTVKNKCYTKKPVKKKCANFSECETGNCSDGICKDYPKVRKAGETCGGAVSNVCAMGHYCSDETKKCVSF